MSAFLTFVGTTVTVLVVVVAICAGILGACVWHGIKSGKWHE